MNTKRNKIVILIGGASGSGKSLLCSTINNAMKFDQSFKVAIVPLDCFYKGNIT